MGVLTLQVVQYTVNIQILNKVLSVVLDKEGLPLDTGRIHDDVIYVTDDEGYELPTPVLATVGTVIRQSDNQTTRTQEQL